MFFPISQHAWESCLICLTVTNKNDAPLPLDILSTKITLLAVSYRYDLDYYLHEENFTSTIPAHTAYIHSVVKQCSLCCHTPTQSQTHKHAPDFQRIYAKKTALKITCISLHINTVIGTPQGMFCVSLWYVWCHASDQR